MLISAKLAFYLTAAGAGAGATTLVADPAALHLPGRHATGPACDRTVGHAICAITTDQNVRDAMRLGALLEGGGLDGPWRCGDHGWSCGPWQINRSVHAGVSRAEASDAGWAARYMLPAYRRACSSVSAATWRLDRRGAAAVCVFRAERPAVMYSTARVRAAWAQLGGK